MLYIKELEAFIKECWQTSEDKGWHDKFELAQRILERAHAQNWPAEEVQALKEDLEKQRIRMLVEKLALIHTEVSEATEALRDPKIDPKKTYYEINGVLYASDEVNAEDMRDHKPEGFGSELADIIIRVADLAMIAEVDLVQALLTKMLANTKRAHRHGGKRL